MAGLDFSRINKEKVGYLFEYRKYYAALDFENFIQPFSHKAKSYQELYELLKIALDESLKSLDSLIEVRIPETTNGVAKSALYREALRNSIDLIKENYLK